MMLGVISPGALHYTWLWWGANASEQAPERFTGADQRSDTGITQLVPAPT